MSKNLTPQDQWETEFEVPLPGEPRSIGPLETLFQRLLNRTERLRSRIGDLLGLPWDSTPPDTIAGLHQRVGTLEAAQGGTTLQAHRSAPVLDHPDGSVTLPKLGAGLGYGSNAFVDPNAYYDQTGQPYPMQVGEVARFTAVGVPNLPLRIAVSEGQVYEFVVVTLGTIASGLILFPNGNAYAGEFAESLILVNQSGQIDAGYSSSNRNNYFLCGNSTVAKGVIDIRQRLIVRISSEVNNQNLLLGALSAFWWAGTTNWTWLGTLSVSAGNLNHELIIRRVV